MTTFAVSFKEHVRKLARKEIRRETQVLRRASAQRRRDVAALRRQMAAMAKQMQRMGASGNMQTRDTDAPEGTRFSARSVAAQRRRLGLSAADFGKLIGASALTVYHWEHGKARPRQNKLAAFAAIRGVGRREAMDRLARLSSRKLQ
jgi:DNA-binding transcriptional regulator YiaG